YRVSLCSLQLRTPSQNRCNLGRPWRCQPHSRRCMMGAPNAALTQLLTSTWATANGSPTPLGVTRVAASKAYNFALYSKHSTRIRLLLFSADDLVNPISIYEFDQFRNRTGRIWHADIPEKQLKNAKYYAYSIDGPAPTGRQHEWNAFRAAKMLIDP